VRAHKPIAEESLALLFRYASDILFQEGSIITVTAPVTVCGDVHGQFYDVLLLLDVAGPPPDTKYLFLGDYVDRGYFSIETFALLLAYKVKYPARFFLLRGNHECRQVNQMYGIYVEIVTRFGHPGPYKMCNEMFDYLPIAALIENKIFCVHGGLSPEVRVVEQIASFDRLHEIPSSGAISDLCWSDPAEPGGDDGWATNQRGAGFLFGRNTVREFCHNNRLTFIARAHQLAAEGFQWHFGADRMLVTVWSAPNYMYRCGNRASVMVLGEELEPEFRQFDAVPQDKRVVPDESFPPYFT
jgi:diadenosine tetraphosphatase ApaH/serine/threonine PP2A family protein phosphatase